MWYVTGYGIALGEDTFPTSGNNGFIGTDKFLLTTGFFRGDGADVGLNWAGWLFQWAFAATTATSEFERQRAGVRAVDASTRP